MTTTTTHNPETWILYKASSDAEGWLDRKLMPSGSLTDLLSEVHFWGNHALPTPGDRFTVLDSRDGTGRVSHAAEGNWVVAQVYVYDAPHPDAPRIVVCQCDYSPIEQDWQPMNRMEPIAAIAD
ncbi:MAG: hypothetical protein MH825_07895 [Cyanobacteria bacterium]|nr:hypothetical protein [Cyanobacteriota bacterium]